MSSLEEIGREYKDLKAFGCHALDAFVVVLDSCSDKKKARASEMLEACFMQK